MKKFFPLCLLLIVALVWTISVAGNFDRVPTANSSQQTKVEKSQNLDAVQGDEMTPEKADRIRAEKDARHEEMLRSMAGEEVSSEEAVEYPPDALTNYGGEAAPDYIYGPVTIAETAMPSSEFRMRELKADGVISDNERAEYEQILSTTTPSVEIPMPLSIVYETEPNNDCASADAIACGDTVWCATQTTGSDDHDWFTFTLDNTYPSWEVTIETHPTSGACDPASSDTYLELWSGDCQVFITSDDDGGIGWFSLITINLVPGSYAIHEDNTIWYSSGSYHLSLTCAEDTCYGNTPPNDLCSSVTPVALTPDVPQVFNGTSACATIDCSLLGNPHVWEAFTTSQAGDLVIEYCGSLYNGGPWGNGYIVLEASCPCVSNLYYSSYDFGCVDGNVRIYWDNLPAGTYYYPMIWDPANNAGGAYTITVTLNTIIPCDVVCPSPNAFIENEPLCGTDYVDNTNGGCNSSPYVFQYIDCGDTVCGQSGTYLYQGSQYRDTDWYEFTTTTTMDITMTGAAEFDFQMYLVDPGDCSSPSVIGSHVPADPCSLATLTVYGVPPGTYVAFAAPAVFSGYDGCGFDYWFALDCVEPIGRCCYNNDLDCADITESACNALAGDWVAGLNCTDNPCICPEDQVVIEIFTDNYPTETTWDLVDQYSNIIAQGGPYSNSGTLYTHEICVEDTSCLFFTIYDLFGDGICCSYGYGYYNVYFNGSLQGTGGDFGYSESVGPFGGGCVDVGRCCYGDPYNPSCADNMQSECAALGGTWTWGMNCTNNPCPALPVNDSCSGAITVAVPSSTPGSTTMATPDTLDCGTYQYARSVWYKVVGTGNTITATTCDAGSNYDTKLQVWCNTCNDLMCVGGNDDMGSTNCSYGGLLSAVSWCSEQGVEYLILVGGFSSYSGNFVLNVSDDGTPCSTPPNCAPPIGRCCYNNDQDCADITEDACTALGGYWNEFMNCVDNPCSCPTGQDKIMLDLWTDSWPSEVTWEIYERTTGLVAAGGPYADPNTNYVEEICVAQGGCYDWYIYDSFGDGGGPYDLYYAGTLVHSSDGNYGTGEAVFDIGNSGCGQPSGACCFYDGSCADLSEDDCIAQGGASWQIYETCANVECPIVLQCDTTALWHNGFPIGYAHASQCDPVYPMQAEMADDFVLSGTDPVDVGWVIAWFDHWNGNVNGPADYLGINVTVYANDDISLPYDAPGGKPIDGDTSCAHMDIIPGGVVYTTEVAPGDFAYFEEGGYWRLQIPISVTLNPDETYWLSVEPIMIFADAGQSGWVDGDMLQGNQSVQIFELLSINVWTQQGVDMAFCLLPPAGGCDYIVGDVNGSGNYNGLDITYGVAYFKGGSAPLCDPNCPPCAGWHYCGDVNGSCNYNGLDITYGVAYFKGGPSPIPCDDCPPIGGLTGDNQAPEMPQVIKSKTINQKGSGLK